MKVLIFLSAFLSFKAFADYIVLNDKMKIRVVDLDRAARESFINLKQSVIENDFNKFKQNSYVIKGQDQYTEKFKQYFQSWRLLEQEGREVKLSKIKYADKEIYGSRLIIKYHYQVPIAGGSEVYDSETFEGSKYSQGEFIFDCDDFFYYPSEDSLDYKLNVKCLFKGII